MTWAILSKLEDGRVQVTHIASGALCGLAGITPGSGFLMPVAGVPVGIIVGLSGWYVETDKKTNAAPVDDSDGVCAMACPNTRGLTPPSVVR